MRGKFQDQGGLFSYISSEKRVAANHPLRKIRELVRDVLKELTHSLGKLYASDGRPSVAPEQLLSALLLQVFYGIRSERQLMEQLEYNLLYRWFVGLSPDDPVWDPTTFTPRPPAGGRCLSKIHEQAAQPSAGEAVIVGRTLFGGRHADRSLGLAQELPPQGRQRRERHGFPRAEAQQRYSCEHDRSGQPALSQGGGPRSEAVLHGTRHHGEPQRTCGGRRGYPCQRHGRAARVGAHAQGKEPRGRPHHHGRRGQGLRHVRSRRGAARHRRDATCRAEHCRDQDRQAAQERDRWPHHAARRLWHVAKPPGGDRMHFRLWQATRHLAQDEAPLKAHTTPQKWGGKPQISHFFSRLLMGDIGITVDHASPPHATSRWL